MAVRKRLLSLARNIARRARVETELSEEMRSYLELATEAKMKNGMNERDARRAASMELGGAEQVKEQVRDIRTGHFIETRLQDIRFAFRTLCKAPVFSLTVAAVLALGIGSTALMFTIVNSILLKGPPFPEADRLFMLWQDLPQEKGVSFSTREFTVWSEQTQVFESMAALTGAGFTITGRGEPELAMGQRVTPSLFKTLGVQPALGREFLDAEGKAGQSRAVILSHTLWREKFSGRQDVLGQTVVMNGEPYTIVGVMPETFDFPRRETQLWVPAALDEPLFQQHLDAHFLRVIARLKPGVTPERVQAEMDLLGTRVNAPDDDTVRRFYPVSLQEMTSGDVRRPLLVLLCAVAFLLLIACANVANLMFARSSARQAEMAIRSALGASRRRLVAQLLTESALLALLGAAGGIALAMWGLDVLQLLASASLPQLVHARIDIQTLGFTLLAAALAASVFGVAPALNASRTDVSDALRGATRATGNAATERMRQWLVLGEVALACVLLVGCGLMVRSFVALVHADPGFRAESLVVADTVLRQDRYPDPAAVLRFNREALARITELPSVQSSSVITHLPFGGNGWGNGYEVEGQPAPQGVQYSAQIRPVSPGYFRTLGIPLKQGRDFDERDNENATGVAIVNEVFAQRFWPNESPLGKRISYSGTMLPIVGVCGNVKHARLDGEPDAEIYVPLAQVPARTLEFVGRNLNYVVRATNPAVAAMQLRSAIRAVDREMVVEVNTMEALIRDSTAQPRFRTWLIGIVSAFALILACIGIYGVIAYLVTQRYKEIGIRIALGATRRDILALVLGRTLRLTGIGIVGGLVGAFFLAGFLSSILFGIDSHDPFTFVAVPACLIVMALLAGYLPARRATGVNPVTSLRYE